MAKPINTSNGGKIYTWVYLLLVAPAYFVLSHFELLNQTTGLVNVIFLTLISTVIPALVVTALILIVRTFVLKK